MTSQITWVTLDESPIVRAARELLVDIPGLANLTQPFDIRTYTDWLTIPVENIEYLFAFLDIPSGTFLGEEFQRTAYRDLFTLIQSRNYRTSLSVFARAARIAYIATFIIVNEQKVHLEICISNTPAGIDPTTYINRITAWFRWLMEWWRDDMTVFTCQSTELDPRLTIAGSAVHVYPATLFTQV